MTAGVPAVRMHVHVLTVSHLRLLTAAGASMPAACTQVWVCIHPALVRWRCVAVQCAARCRIVHRCCAQGLCGGLGATEASS